MKTILLGAALVLVAAGAASAEDFVYWQGGKMNTPLVGENATKVSDHVWVIAAFPNIAIVVGSSATLVVDTGLGPKNGASVARVAAKLAPGNAKLFLTTTHYHPEHASGEPGFPAGTILIRNAVQQEELDKHGAEMIERFRGFSAQNRELLSGVVLRRPDVTFDQDAVVDLGGVTARLFWLGAAHTKGDELTFITPDRTLVSGDVVQNNTAPHIFDYGEGSTPSTWLGVLDKLAALQLDIRHIVPDHSAPGDGALVKAQRDLIVELQSRALALKRRGVNAEDAGKRVSEALKAEHADWANTNADEFVKSIYSDPQSPP